MVSCSRHLAWCKEDAFRRTSSLESSHHPSMAPSQCFNFSTNIPERPGFFSSDTISEPAINQAQTGS
ncbi:uncharacterized protein BCR38DRAFT_418135 [Pseudomassariella vexata]|uniref:Uncharacterized protein n=1 Tax=Pseudomassariella vexata TaxID=1141098 RepID=A0A1Y2EJU1_9PEZI|nr:uncharacterized protein BCR38DRAFT_418135 [Pseudomassariella vexata]ORY71810.1 hypothetical protein BCR38DRAFT_418135 [Pseudomassariella vexata]